MNGQHLVNNGSLFATLIVYVIAFKKIESVTRNKGVYIIMLKGLTHQKDVTCMFACT